MPLLFPLNAPAVSARSVEWQEYLSGASDMDLVTCAQAAHYLDDDRLRGMIFNAAGARFLIRTKLSKRPHACPHSD